MRLEILLENTDEISEAGLELEIGDLRGDELGLEVLLLDLY